MRACVRAEALCEARKSVRRTHRESWGHRGKKAIVPHSHVEWAGRGGVRWG